MLFAKCRKRKIHMRTNQKPMQSEPSYLNCMHFMRSDEIKSHLRKQSRSEAEKCMEDFEKQNELLKVLLEKKKKELSAQELAYRYFMMKLWEKLPCYVKPCIRDFFSEMCRKPH